MTLLILPGGAAIEPDGTIVGVDESGEIRLHANQAEIRLIERWKLPNAKALLRTYTDELQEVENMLWDVMVLRLLDYAGEDQLRMIGNIVGQPQQGLTIPQWRARIRVRIRINRSNGTAVDIIEVLRMFTPEEFTYQDLPLADFRIEYQTTPPAYIAEELASVVSETRAAGIGADVVIPTTGVDEQFRFSGVSGPGPGLGFGHVSGTVGGLLSHSEGA